MECERLPNCPFFTDKLPAMPNIAHMLKQQYCLSDKVKCARYIVVTAGLEAPLNLFPNDVERAHEMLRKAGVTPKK